MSAETKVCPDCGGCGYTKHWNADDYECARCDGTGVVPLTDADREAAGQLSALPQEEGRT